MGGGLEWASKEEKRKLSRQEIEEKAERDRRIEIIKKIKADIEFDSWKMAEWIYDRVINRDNV